MSERSIHEAYNWFLRCAKQSSISNMAICCMTQKAKLKNDMVLTAVPRGKLRK